MIEKSASSASDSFSIVSEPYVKMTIDLMRRFGVHVNHKEFKKFHVPLQSYQSPGSIFVEGDAFTTRLKN